MQTPLQLNIEDHSKLSNDDLVETKKYIQDGSLNLLQSMLNILAIGLKIEVVI